MGRIFECVESFLKSDDWPYTLVEGQTIAKSSFQGKNGAFNLFAQAREEQDHLVFYAVLPVFTPEERRAEMTRFITRANSGMMIGNFELDLNDGEVRFKTSADLEDVPEFSLLLRNLLYANALTMDRYLTGLMRIIYGGVGGDEAIREIEGA